MHLCGITTVQPRILPSLLRLMHKSRRANDPLPVMHLCGITRARLQAGSAWLQAGSAHRRS